jgi:hypothetical protein
LRCSRDSAGSSVTARIAVFSPFSIRACGQWDMGVDF